MGQLIDELKRRNVFRVAVAYLVATWLVLQVADLVLENIGAPAWVMQVLILLFALGFPLALIFSWAYELTPEGIKREKDVDRTESVTRQTGRKLNQITIGLLLFVLVVVAAERFLVPDRVPAEQAAESAGISDKSIAVLAFEDLSADGDQGYFADGLSEELLNVLAQNPDLQVAGRTSSFAFKGQNTDLREIGEILNVAHILEGSVRKAGNRIRVTAQLINADDGFHLFSETYDRDLNDIFAVQDELAARISTALQSELIGTDSIQESTPTDIETFDWYLEARQKIHSREKLAMEEAIDLLDRALSEDPNYAPALTQKALALYLLSDSMGAYGDIPVDEAITVARPLVDRALELDDRLADAYAVSGLLMDAENVDDETRIRALRRAVALNPNLDNARTWLADALADVGQFEEARALLEGIVERDPMFGPAFNNLVSTYNASREFDKAEGLIRRVERITGRTTNVDQAWGMVAFSRGELAEAYRLFDSVLEEEPNSTVVGVNYGFTLFRLGEWEAMKDVNFPPMRVFARLNLGETEQALAMFEQMKPFATFENTIDFHAFVYAYTDQFEQLVAEIDSHYGSLDELLDAQPRTAANAGGNGYLTPLAYTYQQIGDTESFDKVVDAMRVSTDIGERPDLQVFPVINAQAEYAAMTGNVDLLISTTRKLVDIDGSAVNFLSPPWFEPYRDNEELRGLDQIMIDRSNAERAKLGLAPYQPELAL